MMRGTPCSLGISSSGIPKMGLHWLGDREEERIFFKTVFVDCVSELRWVLADNFSENMRCCVEDLNDLKLLCVDVFNEWKADDFWNESGALK